MLFSWFQQLAWFRPIDDSGAILATANATRWLILATMAASAATIAAVVITLRHEANVRRQERRRLDRAALTAVERAFALVHKIHDDRKKHPVVAETQLWPVLATLNSHRRVLEHYLTFPMSDEELPYLLADALQRIYEVRDAVAGLLPKEHGASWLEVSQGILVRAVSRMADPEKSASEAKARIG